MDSETGQWEKIFQRDGYVYHEPAPPVMHFADLLMEHSLHSILDLGCGTGRHTVHMAQKGLNATGMDNSLTALKLSRAWLDREHLHANLLLADMRYSFPFKDLSFDAVLSVQVIHHARLATVIATANEITRITRKGGLILISVPLRRTVEEDSPEFVEIEPDTIVPSGGDEKGLPHHLFRPEEFRDIFPQFEVMDLRVIIDKIIALTAIKKTDH